jgi:hypothetical protein
LRIGCRVAARRIRDGTSETLAAIAALHYPCVPCDRRPVVNPEVGDPANGYPDSL